ncbi:ATP-binding protein [Bradyrhizobium barranii]|uniref:ATP-binding protein n=1 Tax=Bradyrhizobium barranii TaxID=2992140 RepID=A0ABY3QQZ4_9BRAD|nr:ATP-binding protein [Bradyrhizobium japonicum]UFW88435.1 ATP-binding protein [Bradyrhizobium japonicum]
MASLDLIDLLAAANEDLGIEFKAWMDTRSHDARAKLARHIAALANHGGGYLIFGVDDKTRKRAGPGCLDSAPLDLSGFLPGYAERGALRFCRCVGRA